MSTVFSFSYTGNVQTKTLSPGKYLLECWGAQGNGRDITGNSNSGIGCKGGYSRGIVELEEETKIYVYVGGQGSYTFSVGSCTQGSFNGGGNACCDADHDPGHSGGGGTDIRFVTDSLNSRIIVAGGGGGGGEDGQQGGH